jgi:alanine racemase
MSYFISGIQQIGIGVANVKEAFDLYRKAFGNDIPVFNAAIHSREATYASRNISRKHERRWWL